MTFRIIKLSEQGIDGTVNKPCSGARRGTYQRYGMDIPAWLVDISTLEDLMGLMNEVGFSLVLKPNEIEIYDDWRE